MEVLQHRCQLSARSFISYYGTVMTERKEGRGQEHEVETRKDLKEEQDEVGQGGEMEKKGEMGKR